VYERSRPAESSSTLDKAVGLQTQPFAALIVRRMPVVSGNLLPFAEIGTRVRSVMEMRGSGARYPGSNDPDSALPQAQAARCSCSQALLCHLEDHDAAVS